MNQGASKRGDQSQYRASVGSTRVIDFVLADDTIILAEFLEVLMMALETMHEETKPLRFHLSFAKNKLQASEVIHNETAQSVYPCSVDTTILESFTYVSS